MNPLRTLLTLSLAALPFSAMAAQESGAVSLDQRIRGLTVTARVLIIGAHPDDEDTRLITWLSRARNIETAYLSLTRGENGVNVAGFELGDGLGAVRTAEVLEARRIDGAQQFFTRAYDFGYSRTAEETFKHWPPDGVLGDMVTVIRAFRPHVIIARYAGTPEDGDGHHEASALLARRVFHAAADTAAFPVALHGFPWSPRSLYGPGPGLTIDLGGFDPVSGRTWTAIAAESRAMHRTQGFPDSLNATVDDRHLMLARTASIAVDSTLPATSLFDGIDTTFARLGAAGPDTVTRIIEVIAALADSARNRVDLRNPDGVVRYLARAARLAAWVRSRLPRCLHPSMDASAFPTPAITCARPDRLDLDAALDLVTRRANEAAILAAGVDIKMLADREVVAYGDSVPATLIIANHGRSTIQFLTVSISGTPDRRIRNQDIPPDSTARWTVPVQIAGSTVPWWIGQRLQDLYEPFRSALDGLARPASRGTDRVTIPAVGIPENIRRVSDVSVILRIDGHPISMSVGPIVHRSADALGGVQQRFVTGAPAISLGFDHSLEWVPTGKPIDRLLRFSLESTADSTRTVSLHLVAPEGLRVDSLPKTVTLAPSQSTELLLRVRGTLQPGRYPFGLFAKDADSAQFDRGMRAIRYPHLRPIHMSRGSALWMQGVEITVPSRLTVAYLQGVGDLITPYLRQLGVRLTVIGYDELLNADLSRFTTVVVGPRAYEAHPELVATNGRLLDFTRRGGTLLVLGGTAATYAYNVFPWPVGPAADGTTDRVTVENAPVNVVTPGSKLLAWPNRITENDWHMWVSERASFMPKVIDSRYATPLEMHDPGQPENRGALLVTRLGRGTYIYTTLALVAQLPGAVTGAARLFVNLLSAGLEPPSGESQPPPE